ncbi:hypothetical protein [Hasllibacter sp. MH4015]|uniref:hypothetical protein n=1 Tax=Hasllibacter sp. MH4015 TaxID=2854029 RepID=UPI001CD5639F|nr:hypothetical protein [Hasllibacter sp. MH4015]
MSTQALSLHRVAYDPEMSAFRAEAQILDASGIHRRPILWRGPTTADFKRIARGLRDAALGGTA